MASNYTYDCEQRLYNEEEERLTLAFENLDHIPPSITNNFSSTIKILDLSHNNFSNLSFLQHFPMLTSLILDHNMVNSSTTFPTMLQLKILWLNHNRISQLFPFIQRLRAAFPSLIFLSLMANEAVPVNVDGSTFYQHLQYRLFVVSWFPALEHLDDQPVTVDERMEAHRLYKRPLLERLINKEPVRKIAKSLSGVLGLVQRHNQSSGLKSSFV
uniref:U2A'/phosphoprotein 32 family A C-terminal domain-containing protein n=1 Tax=Cuerna arida TaxID=1464854 RepID=A0A1B6FF38_9HEMI